MSFPIGIAQLQVKHGNEKHHYRDIPNLEALLAERKMPDAAAIWGWGDYYRAACDYLEFFERSFAGLAADLQSQSLQPDTVIVSAAPQALQGALTETIASWFPDLNAQAKVVFVSESGCASLVRAVERAAGLLGAESRRILLLEAALVTDESTRFDKFALFSDASLAMLLQDDTTDCTLLIEDALSLANNTPDSGEDDIVVRALDGECVEQLLSRNDLFAEEIDQLCYMNLFKPMTVEKAKGMGFDANSVFTDNIPLFGHCFGIDPLLNMQHYFGQPDAGSTALLGASSRQYAGAILVKRQ